MNRLSANNLHEQVMECEIRKELLTWELIVAEEGSEKEAVIAELLHETITIGLDAMRRLDRIAEQN